MNHRSSSSRRKFLAAAGAASSVILAGCGGDEAGGTPETEEPDTDESVVLQRAGTRIENLDPIAIGSNERNRIHAGLVIYSRDSLDIEPSIAESWSISEDNTRYEFELRKGVEFHNGEEITAQDFVYSWERLAGSENTDNSEQILEPPMVLTHDVDEDGEYVPNSLAVEAVDDYTFAFELEQPFHSVLEMLTHESLSVIPEGIVGDLSGYDGEIEYENWLVEDVVGAGPFQVAEVEPGVSVQFSPHEEYHLEGPFVDEMSRTYFQDDEAEYNSAMERNLDLFSVPLQRFDPSKIAISEIDEYGAEYGEYGPLQNDEFANIVLRPGRDTTYLLFNTELVPQYVRRAAAYAINQEELVESAWAGVDRPAYHYMPPSVFPGGSEAYNSHAQEHYPYGYNESLFDEGAELLESNGYDENNTYDLSVGLPSDWGAEWNEAATMIRNKLQTCHIEVEVVEQPMSTIFGQISEGALDSVLTSAPLEYPEGDSILQYAYPSDWSWNNWSGSAAAEQAMDAWETIQANSGPTEAEQEIREEKYLEIERAVWEDVTDIVIRHERDITMWYDWVNYTPTPTRIQRQKYNTVSIESRE